MSNIIEVNNLSKQFKIRTNKNLITGMFDPKYQLVEAVKDVSFEVREGESLAFLGPNGAGKTTTTKMLTGLIYPTAGNIKVFEYTPFDRKKDFLMQIGLVMGNKTGLSWDLTGAQSFDFIKKIYHIEDSKYKATLSNLCELLDVNKHLNKQIRKLSLGERMKMELIGAILHSPKVLFLDEPTIGLHPEDIAKLLPIFNTLVDKGNTVVIIEHNLDILAAADHLIDLGPGAGEQGGEIIATGTPEELSKCPSSLTGKYLAKILSI